MIDFILYFPLVIWKWSLAFITGIIFTPLVVIDSIRENKPLKEMYIEVIFSVFAENK